MKFRFSLSILSITFHFVLGKIKGKRKNNIKIRYSTLLWKSKVNVKGQNNSVLIDENCNLKKTNIIIKGNSNKVIIFDSIKIYERCEILVEGNNCEIIIGAKTTIGSAKIFCGESNTSVKIGEDCMLSREVSMNTSDFHSIINIKTKERINIPQNIKIENHVWIGFNSRINKGAEIRKDSIVATGAIVAGKSYPSNVILAGIPAKIIKENITWSRENLPY